MLPNAHLTSYSTMIGSRWVTTSSWQSESLRPFLHSFSVYSCLLFLISLASVRSLPFLSFIVPTFGWNLPLIYPIFLKRSLVLPFLLFSFIYLHCSLKKASYLSWLFSGTLHSVGYIFPHFSCFSLLFFPQLFVKPPQTITLASFISFSLGCFWSLPPILYYKPSSIALQTFCLQDLILWIYTSPPVYNQVMI